MSPDGDLPPGLSRLLQLAAGLAAGCGAALLVLLLALAGVSVGTAAWVGLFLAVWAAVFALLRLRLPWAVAGFVFGAAAGFLVLARYSDF